MAYGKDKEQLKNISGFRKPTDLRQQSSMQGDRRQATRGGGGSGGGGKAPTWVNSFKPPKVGQALIRLCKEQYVVEMAVEGSKDGSTEEVELNYFPYIEHFNAKKRHAPVKKSTICSGGAWAGNKKFCKECKGCEAYFAGMQIDPKTGKKKQGHVSKRDMNAVSLLNYANFHLSPQVDKKGDPRLNPETQEPYMHWVECTGRNCTGCKDGDKTEKGKMQHWSLGSAHWNALLDHNDKLKMDCVSCGSEGTIVTIGYFCQNPDCGVPVIEVETTTYSDADIAKIIKDPVKCPDCGTRDYLKCMYECSNCEDPKQASIFDVDMKVSRAEASDGSEQTTLQVGSKFLRGLSAEFADKFKPLPIDKIFAPDSLEEQAIVFDESDDAPTKGAAAYTRGRT